MKRPSESDYTSQVAYTRALEAYCDAKREWIGLDRKEMLTIIDQQRADKKTGLPMFYRDQCLVIANAIEAKLKEKNYD